MRRTVGNWSYYPKVEEGPGICHDLFDLYTEHHPLALRYIQVYACHTLKSTLSKKWVPQLGRETKHLTRDDWIPGLYIPLI